MVKAIIILNKSVLILQVPWFLYSCCIIHKVFVLLSINLFASLVKDRQCCCI